MKDYIINQKTFYTINPNKHNENTQLSVSRSEGIYDIYNVYFQLNVLPIEITDSTGALFVSRCIFEECFPSSDPGIKVDCQNNEFDVSISKTCFYNCGINSVRCVHILGDSDSFVQLSDLSISMCQVMSSSGVVAVAYYKSVEMIGFNGSHLGAYRHAGPFLTNENNQAKFMTIAKCQSTQGIFVFLDEGNSIASHLIVTNNTVTNTLVNYACVFSNSQIYIKESYIMNNPTCYSFYGGTLRAYNCVCDSLPSKGNITTTSFPEPQLRHLSLGKCVAKNLLVDCAPSESTLIQKKLLFNLIALLLLYNILSFNIL